MNRAPGLFRMDAQRKSLAEAGRRKLEEFRKAKQQAKQAPRTPNGTASSEQTHSQQTVTSSPSPGGPDQFKSGHDSMPPFPSPAASPPLQHDSPVVTFGGTPTSVTIITDGVIPFTSGSTNGHVQDLFGSTPVHEPPAASTTPQPYSISGSDQQHLSIPFTAAASTPSPQEVPASSTPAGSWQDSQGNSCWASTQHTAARQFDSSLPHNAPSMPRFEASASTDVSFYGTAFSQSHTVSPHDTNQPYPVADISAGGMAPADSGATSWISGPQAPEQGGPSTTTTQSDTSATPVTEAASGALPWAQPAPHHASPSTGMGQIQTSPPRASIPLAANSLADLFGGPGSSSPDWARSLAPSGFAEPHLHSGSPHASQPSMFSSQPAAAQPQQPPAADFPLWQVTPPAESAPQAVPAGADVSLQHAVWTPASYDAGSQGFVAAPGGDVFPSESIAFSPVEPVGTPLAQEGLVVEPVPLPWQPAASHDSTWQPTAPPVMAPGHHLPELGVALTPEPALQHWSPNPSAHEAQQQQEQQQEQQQQQQQQQQSSWSPPPSAPEQPAGQRATTKVGGRFAWLFGAGKSTGREEQAEQKADVAMSFGEDRPQAVGSQQEATYGPGLQGDRAGALVGVSHTADAMGYPAEGSGSGYDGAWPQTGSGRDAARTGADPAGTRERGEGREEVVRPAYSTEVVSTLSPPAPDESAVTTFTGHLMVSGAGLGLGEQSDDASTAASDGEAPVVSDTMQLPPVPLVAWQQPPTAPEPGSSSQQHVFDSSSWLAGASATASATQATPSTAAATASTSAAAQHDPLDSISLPDTAPSGSTYASTRPSWLFASQNPAPVAATTPTPFPHSSSATPSALLPSPDLGSAPRPPGAQEPSAAPPDATSSNPTAGSVTTRPAWNAVSSHAEAPAALTSVTQATPAAVSLPSGSAAGPSESSMFGTAPPQPNDKPEPSFLEAYLDNLLRLDDGAGATSNGAAEERSRLYTSVGGEGDAALSRRVSSNGGAAGADASNHRASIDGSEGAAKLPGAGSVGLAPAGPEGLSSSGAGGQPNGLPPRAPQGAAHRRHGSDESQQLHQESSNSFAPASALHASSSSQQFSLLQQHIDELTEEKLGLQRGLAAQMRLAADLAEENQAVTDQYNVQAQMVQSLRKKIQQYEDELEAQVLALEGLASERENARAVAQETAARLSSVAAEVVSLEQTVLSEKSARLRAEAASKEAMASASELEKKVTGLQRKASEARAETEKLTAERRSLLGQVKLLEAKLERAEAQLQQQQHNRSHATAVKVEVPVRVTPPMVDCDVQCDLLPLTPVPEPALAAAPGGPQVAEPTETGLASGTAEDLAEFSQLALRPEDSGSSDVSFVQQGDAPSAVIADRALASLSTAGRSGGAAASSSDALALLSRWLPQGPISGSSPVAAVAEEEVRAMQSVHERLEEYQQVLLELLDELRLARDDYDAMLFDNQQLRQQLHGLLGAASNGPVAISSKHTASEVHVNPPYASFVEATPHAHTNTPYSVQLPNSHVAEQSVGQWTDHLPQLQHPGATMLQHTIAPPNGGSSASAVDSAHVAYADALPMHASSQAPPHTDLQPQAHGSRTPVQHQQTGLQLTRGPQAVQPMQDRLQMLQHVQDSSSPADHDWNYGAQQQASALVTPPHTQLSYAVLPGQTPGLPSSTSQQQQRSGWLGFLFRGGGSGRPKKRVREALI